MKILLTGSAGFIGSNILKEFKFAKFLTITRSSNDINNIRKSISELNNSDMERIINFNPTVVINSAWSNVGNYDFDNSILNINSQLQFLNSLSKLDSIEKFINFGSCWECEMYNGNVMENEDFKTNNPFLIAKKTIFDFSNLLFPDKHYWLRIFYIFGPGQKKGLIKYVTKNILNELKIRVNSPNSILDYLPIKDFLTILSSILSKSINPGIYNIASDKPIKNIDLIQIIICRINKKVEKNYNLNNFLELNTNIDIPDLFFWGSLNKLKKEINDESFFTYSLIETIDNIIDDELNNA